MPSLSAARTLVERERSAGRRSFTATGKLRIIDELELRVHVLRGGHLVHQRLPLAALVIPELRARWHDKARAIFKSPASTVPHLAQAMKEVRRWRFANCARTMAALSCAAPLADPSSSLRTPPGRRRLLLEEARVDGLDVARQVRVARAVLGRALDRAGPPAAVAAPARGPSRAHARMLECCAHHRQGLSKTAQLCAQSVCSLAVSWHVQGGAQRFLTNRACSDFDLQVG